MRRQSGWIWACWLVLSLSAGRQGRADLIYTVQDLGQGPYEYDFIINNTNYVNLTTDLPEPISGLNFLHGNSGFGLDQNSTIGAPPGWSYFAPLPPFVDELNFFSLSPTTDIPIGGSLGGFSFQSTVAPTASSAAVFPDTQYDVIGATTSTQLYHTPEPASLVMLMTGLLGLLGYVRCRHPRARS